MNSIPYITLKVNVFYKKNLYKYSFYVNFLQGFTESLFIFLLFLQFSPYSSYLNKFSLVFVVYLYIIRLQ